MSLKLTEFLQRNFFNCATPQSFWCVHLSSSEEAIFLHFDLTSLHLDFINTNYSQMEHSTEYIPFTFPMWISKIINFPGGRDFSLKRLMTCLCNNPSKFKSHVIKTRSLKEMKERTGCGECHKFQFLVWNKQIAILLLEFNSYRDFIHSL